MEKLDFTYQLKAYRAHNPTRPWVPLGLESTTDQLIVINNAGGAVCIHDCDFQEFIPLAANLTELIRSLA